MSELEMRRLAVATLARGTPYDYIARAYGCVYLPGDKVRHTVTNKCGEVKRPKKSHLHYVRVHFGADGLGLCHPHELEIINKEPQMTKERFLPLTESQPRDLEVCECWDDDEGVPVFGQWLDGAQQFFSADVKPLHEVTCWRPVITRERLEHGEDERSQELTRRLLDRPRLFETVKN